MARSAKRATYGGSRSGSTKAKREAAIEPEPQTSIDEAVRVTLEGLGCLKQTDR